MNLSLSEALERVRSWERRGTKLYGLVLHGPSPLIIRFSGFVAVHEQAITLGHDETCELILVFLPEMTYTYREAILHIRGSEWHCGIFETKPDYKLRLVPDKSLD